MVILEKQQLEIVLSEKRFDLLIYWEENDAAQRACAYYAWFSSSLLIDNTVIKKHEENADKLAFISISNHKFYYLQSTRNIKIFHEIICKYYHNNSWTMWSMRRWWIDGCPLILERIRVFNSNSTVDQLLSCRWNLCVVWILCPGLALNVVTFDLHNHDWE